MSTASVDLANYPYYYANNGVGYPYRTLLVQRRSRRTSYKTYFGDLFVDWLGKLLGNTADHVGTFFNLPGFGISEKLAGGNTANTGRITEYGGVKTGGGNYVPEYKKVENAPLGASSVATSYNGGGNASYAGGGTVNTFDPAAMAYYDDQINQANSALGRIGAQRDIGYGNIDNSYNSALNRLMGQNSMAERDFNLNRQRTTDDNVQARARVDQDVSRKSANLRRLLGDDNSAGLFAAPLAVAKQGSQQLGDIQTSYSRNLQNLDIANDDRKRKFDESRGDLDNQRLSNRNNLEAQLKQREAEILDQIGGLNIQKAQARGQNYAQARGTAQGYTDRVNSILSQIDQLGRNPAIATRDINFTAPELAQYNTSDIAFTGGTPTQQAAGPYWNIISDEQKRRQTL